MVNAINWKKTILAEDYMIQCSQKSRFNDVDQTQFNQNLGGFISFG